MADKERDYYKQRDEAVWEEPRTETSMGVRVIERSSPAEREARAMMKKSHRDFVAAEMQHPSTPDRQARMDAARQLMVDAEKLLREAHNPPKQPSILPEYRNQNPVVLRHQADNFEWMANNRNSAESSHWMLTDDDRRIMLEAAKERREQADLLEAEPPKPSWTDTVAGWFLADPGERVPLMAEVLPEDLAEAMANPKNLPTYQQAQEQARRAERRYARAKNPTEARRYGGALTEAYEMLGEAKRRDYVLQSEYGRQDTFWDDIKRQFAPDSLLSDVVRNADTAARNVGGMTAGGASDLLSMLSSMPLAAPGMMPINTAVATKDLETAAQMGKEFDVPPLPYGSEYWIKALGGDIDHPSALPAAFLAPTGSELAAGIRGLTDAPAFIAAMGPHFWKILKGADRKFIDEIWENDFTRRRFLQEVPGVEYKYGTIQIPEDSMQAAERFANARGVTITENMHRFDPPMEGPTFQFQTEAAEDVAERGTRFTRREAPHITPEPNEAGRFRISRFRGDAGEAEGAARQGAGGLGQEEFVVNAGDKSRLGQLRSDFEVGADRMYDLRADPDGLWEQTYKGPGQDLNERIDDYHKLVSENYDASWIYEDEFRAVVYHDLPSAMPRSFSSKRFSAVQGERSGEFIVQNWDDAAAGATETDYVIRAGEHGYDIFKGGERVNDRPLNSFATVTRDLIDETDSWTMWGVRFDGKEFDDVWRIDRIQQSKPIQTRADGWNSASAAFRDLLANADLGGKTIVFTDPGGSMIAFRNSSYLATPSELAKVGGKRVPGEDMTFEFGGGFGKMLREQFDFKKTKDGSWVRLPDPNARRAFTNPDYALQFLDEWY